MSALKYFIIFFLVTFLFQGIEAEKRAKSKMMNELTYPGSPSYVPIPYPKTREEIIVDLKHIINHFYAPREGSFEENISKKVPPSRVYLLNLLEEKPVYKIGDIIKVKNRYSSISSDYTWLIFILNDNGSIAARVAMDASGLWKGTRAHNLDQKSEFMNTEKEVVSFLSGMLNQNISKNEIKTINRVAFQINFGDYFNPLWEISLSDGRFFYYSHSRQALFRIKETRAWGKDKNGNWEDWRNYVPNMDFLPDSINDKIILLEKVKPEK